MRLASFAVDTDVGPVRRVGIAHEGTLLDATVGYGYVLDRQGEAAPVGVAEAVVPPEMVAFLKRGDRAFEAARARSSIRSRMPTRRRGRTARASGTIPTR